MAAFPSLPTCLPFQQQGLRAACSPGPSAIGAPGLHTQQRPGSFLGSWSWGPAWASSGRDLCLHRCVLWEKQVKGCFCQKFSFIFWVELPALFRVAALSLLEVCLVLWPTVLTVSQDSWEQSSEERGRGELISRCPC